MRAILTVALLFAAASLFAQPGKENPWAFIPETGLTEKSQQRQIVPQAYRTLSLDISQMKSLLSEAPMWMTDDAKKKPVVLTLPMPDGTFQDFRIVEAPIMHPDLAAQFPMIKTYAGVGMDDPAAYLRFDLTQRGFHAMVRTPSNSTVFIDPYSTADVAHYISYYKKDFHKADPWECHFDEVNKKKESGEVPPVFEKAGDCQFRTYTLALACTGEYAIYHGGTTPLAFAAMVTTMTRVNGVFENDASVHMELHPNTTALIFLNPATDPYSNGNGSAMLGQNQTTCDNIIGNPNYDIGHVFSTGGGGVAYLGAVCSNSIKAGGVTGQSNPVGDPFDIDYVAHEMGHQYGANHTQNNNCNRNNATAMEPGSASTIMGYAGICSPNVQNNSDDYFHAISLQEIGIQVTSNSSGGGNTCSTNTTINAAPTAEAGPNFTIPRSTPFVLTGTATDPDGDPMTFTWEQMNNQTATMPPLPTNTTGPAFRSFKGTTSPSRYLPRLQDLVNNVSPTWEVLASVGRTYSWRFTVRDNHVGGGCTAEDNMTVTVSAASGPFLVTAPNTAVTWPALSEQTVTWDVANTTASPVSCANVDIFLSLDGGFTYPDTLATAVPNNGSYLVTLPNEQTTQARIMVKGAGNIFFDISNVNFTISAPLDDFTLAVNPLNLGVCVPDDAPFDVVVGALGNFAGDVTLSVNGLPAGVLAVFSENPVTAPGNSTMTISNTASAAPGTYQLTLTGQGSTGQKNSNLTLTLSDELPTSASLLVPANGANGVSLTPLLTWEPVAGATAYQLQVADNANFTNLIIDEPGLTDTEFSVTPALVINTPYYWRVKATNFCGEGAFSAVFSFTTINVICTTFVSTNVPITIPSSGTPTVTSTLNIPVDGTITDVNVLNLNILHTYVNDLIIRLTSPANTQRTLMNRPCGSQNNILINFDDQAANAYGSWPCPPTNNGTYQPFQTLSPFNGQNLNGNWILTVQDVANQDGGSIQAWSLQICYTPACMPPIVNAPTVTQPTCAIPSGSILLNASGNGALEHSADGGATWQPSAQFDGLAPGSYDLVVRLQSDPSCETAFAGNPVVINAVPTAPSMTAPTVEQPTCAAPTGSILLNASGNGALEHSADGGTTWQPSAQFDGLAPGSYDLLVRLQSDPSCETAFTGNPVVINAVPTAPAVNSPTVEQPTCALPSGSILINASGNGALEYSADGGTTWQATAQSDGLAPGSYDLLVRLQSDPTCETAFTGNPVVINAVPTAPSMTAPTVEQPTCAIPSGSILFNASGNGALEHSADGGTTWQLSAQFDGLAPGSYDLLVRLQSAPSCVTAFAGNPVVINAVPIAPSMTAPTVEQPTCAAPTGSILLNASGNGALEHSADGGTTWQATAQFSGLAPGSYDLVVRLQSDPSCETAFAGNPVVINAVPTAPTVNAPTVEQPTCALPSGSIFINASGNGALEHSADGGTTWQATAQFDGLAPGSFDLLVRLQSDPSCETAFTGNPVVINAVPTAPAVNAPTVEQPTCALPSGSIFINAAGNGALEYSADGGTTWQATAHFDGLAPGSYDLLVRLQSDPSCVTAYDENPVNIIAPVLPVVNTPTLVQPTCAVPTGGILINTSGAGVLEYSLDGGTSWQLSNLFTNLAHGEYEVAVRLLFDPECYTFYAGNPVVLEEATGCCPVHLAVDLSPMASGVYEASEIITSTGTVASWGNVLFGAGVSVELLPGFEVELGGVLEVVLQGCVP